MVKLIIGSFLLFVAIITSPAYLKSFFNPLSLNKKYIGDFLRIENINWGRYSKGTIITTTHTINNQKFKNWYEVPHNTPVYRIEKRNSLEVIKGYRNFNGDFFLSSCYWYMPWCMD